MTDSQTLKEPIAFFKPLEKQKIDDEMAQVTRTLQKYKYQMKQLRDRKQ